MFDRKFGMLAALALAGLMVACAPAAGSPDEEEPTDAPTSEPTAEPTEVPTEAEETSEPEEMPGGGIPHPAVLNAQKFLAEELGIDMAAITIVEAEQVEWSDSCLGLGGPAESCLQAITPGWRVIFEANGTEYEVRTDETGGSIRIAGLE